jgi:predicted phage gp36 major capsid-like protein
MPVSAADYKEVVDFRTSRSEVATKALELVNKTKLEKREFTAEENEQYTKLVNEVDNLNGKIETREKLWAAIRVDDEEAMKVPPHLRGQYRETGGVTELEKRQAECLTAYFKGDRNVLNRNEYRDVQLTAPAYGGFLMLPEKMSDRILKKVDDILWISKLSTNIDLTETKTLGIPSIETEMDDLSWTTEIATIPETTAQTFGKRAMVLNPFRSMIKVSDMWLNTITSKTFFSSDDNSGLSVSPMALIENRLAYHIARTKEANFFAGNGVNKPLGMFTASTRGIGTGRDVLQGAGISYAGMVDAKFGLKVQYHQKAIWIFHRSSVGTIMKLVDSNNRPLINFATLPEQPSTVIGHPIMMSEFCPNTVTSGAYVGMFCDPTYYWTIKNPALAIRIVDQLFAQTAQTAFFAMAEADGMPVNDEAFSRLRIT